MKPIEHPEFFRRPAPAGRSRESTIVLNGEGQFFHDGEKVEHTGLARGLARWIRRHPDSGRYILCNGYDWTYFTVQDVPFFVRGVQIQSGQPLLRLSDDSTEPMSLDSLRLGRAGALYVSVKKGDFDARFTPSAQSALYPFVDEGPDGEPVLSVCGQQYPIEGL